MNRGVQSINSRFKPERVVCVQRLYKRANGVELMALYVQVAWLAGRLCDYIEKKNRPLLYLEPACDTVASL